MTPEEVAWLDGVIHPGSRVWEWGSGGSTVWLLERGCIVTSVEHMPHCADVLRTGLAYSSAFHRMDLRVYLCAKEYIEGGEDDGAYEHFAAYVDTYNGEAADVFIVDGRARLACLARLRGLAPSMARVFLHDADRYDYSALAERIGGVGQLHELRLKRCV